VFRPGHPPRAPSGGSSALSGTPGRPPTRSGSAARRRRRAARRSLHITATGTLSTERRRELRLGRDLGEGRRHAVRRPPSNSSPLASGLRHRVEQALTTSTAAEVPGAGRRPTSRSARSSPVARRAAPAARQSHGGRAASQQRDRCGRATGGSGSRCRTGHRHGHAVHESLRDAGRGQQHHARLGRVHRGQAQPTSASCSGTRSAADRARVATQLAVPVSPVSIRRRRAAARGRWRRRRRGGRGGGRARRSSGAEPVAGDQDRQVAGAASPVRAKPAT
jgi:hypothetical protein